MKLSTTKLRQIIKEELLKEEVSDAKIADSIMEDLKTALDLLTKADDRAKQISEPKFRSAIKENLFKIIVKMDIMFDSLLSGAAKGYQDRHNQDE